jgi:IS5 family transposase
MLGKTDKNPQLHIGEIPLVQFINKEHELCRLTEKIDWENVEKEFARFYSNKGAPSIPMRKMIGLILLKKAYGLSDKNSVVQWIENPYWQQFCGETCFQHKAPLYYHDFSHFRQRIGPEGEKMIEKLGHDVFGPVFDKGNLRWGRKHKINEPKNPIFRIIHTFGNYLIRVSS